MSNYLERISAAQAGIDSFYKLLNIYKLSKLNNGWIGTDNSPSNVKLSKFNEYLDEFVSIPSNTTSLFDIPMNCKTYDKNGIYSAGIPSDIGFTQNVPKDSDGMNVEHFPGYTLTYGESWEDEFGNEYYITDFEAGASATADTNVGGVVRYILDSRSNTLTIYPNLSSPIVIDAIDSIWANNTIYTFEPTPAFNQLHMLYIFAVMSQSAGLRLYITSNFITWNIHQIIPGKIDIDIWNELISVNGMELDTGLNKYFSVLPNNNYLIMEPYPLYTETDKSTMVKMYSPFKNEPLLTINDPYETQNYKDKAIHGFSSYLNEYGEVVLYYNNRPETPIVLYNGRVMETLYIDEIIDQSKIAKMYIKPNIDPSQITKKIDGITIDCAVSTLENKYADLSVKDMPAASVSIALGDSYDLGNGEYEKTNSVSLYVDTSIDQMNNIDVDFSSFISSRKVDDDNNSPFIIQYPQPLQNEHPDYGVFAGNWTSICYGNGKYVAFIGDPNAIAYSIDGNTWEVVLMSDVPYFYGTGSICYGDNKFVIVSHGGDGCYSTDGINWSRIMFDYNGGEEEYRSVCYGSNGFLATGRGYCQHSIDGIYWKYASIEFPDDTELWYVKYCNDKYITYCPNYPRFLYSYDGINWIEGNELPMDSVCYGNGIYVSFSGGLPFYSYDGIEWDIANVFADDYQLFGEICYGDGKFVACESSAYSIDGLNWEDGGINKSYNYICYGNGKFVMLDLDGSIASLHFNNYCHATSIKNNNELIIESNSELYRPNVRYRTTAFGNTLLPKDSDQYTKFVNNPSLSYDNITWTNVTVSNTVRYWNSVCYGKDKFVAVADSNIFAYSYDGITWVEGTIYNIDTDWTSVCYGKDKFVAVAYDSNKFAYSYDGIKWTEGTYNIVRDWTCVCYGKDKFVAVSSGTKVFAYSYDGITWAEGTIYNIVRDWTSVCYGNGKFVAVASDSNTFAYSNYGITWTSGVISDTVRDWYSVCYGKDKYVAVAYDSNIFAYSYDGITWNEVTVSDTNRYWHSVCYCKDKYVAVANNDIFAYSYDGITWMEGTISTVAGMNWTSVCYGKDKFVAVAYDSNIFAYSKYRNPIYY